MPESKAKRKKKNQRRRRPPAVQTPPKRKRTPRWVPYVFFGSMGSGAAVIILNYLPIWDFRTYLLFVGLGLIGVAFAASTRWY
jgi:hypothetical protein